MGESVEACSVDGSTRSSCAGSTVGCVTETVGTASFSVSFASALYCSRRCKTVNTPTMTSTTATAIKIKNSRLFAAGLAWLLSLSTSVVILDSASSTKLSRSCRYRFVRCSAQPSALPASMNNGKDARDEEKSSKGGEQQPADNGAAERRVLFAAFPQANRHGHHADNHGQRVHDHRSHAHEAAFPPRAPAILSLILLFSP